MTETVAERVPEAGLLTPSDPNAPSSREQRRRYGDRLDLVNEELVADPEQLHPEQGQGDYRAGGDDSGHSELPESANKITLNRRQRRNILQGVQKALRTHQKIYDVLSEDVHKWTLLEVFAGCSKLTQQADKRAWMGNVTTTRYPLWY